MKRLVGTVLAVTALAACGDDSEFAVGKCTTADPDELISTDVRVVSCDDPEARSRITARKRRDRDCRVPEGTFEDPDDRSYAFCYARK